MSDISGDTEEWRGERHTQAANRAKMPLIQKTTSGASKNNEPCRLGRSSHHQMLLHFGQGPVLEVRQASLAQRLPPGDLAGVQGLGAQVAIANHVALLGRQQSQQLPHRTSPQP